MENHQLKPANTFDLQNLLLKVLRNWYWVLTSLLIALTVAFFVNRYTIPQFEVSSSVMIVKPAEQGASAAALLYGEELFEGSRGLTNESVLIKTKSLVAQTLSKLDFQVSYYQQGNVKLTEVYKSLSPFVVQFDSTATNTPYDVLIKVTPTSNATYTLSSENLQWNGLFSDKKFQSGLPYDISEFRFTITFKHNNGVDTPNELLFKISRPEDLAGSYASRLDVSSMPGGASALVLKIGGNTPEKEKEFLNAHMETYRQNNLEIKNSNAINTLGFIDDQLQQISDSLYFIESRLEDFKKSNSRLDISSEGNNFAQQVQELEKQKASLLLNEKYYTYLKDYLRKGKALDQLVIPSNLGIPDPVLNSLIEKLLELQSEVETISRQNINANPIIANELKVKRQQLSEFSNNILENLRNIEAANSIALNELDKRINAAYAQLQRLPAAERKLINIQRLYNLSENLYVFLMEKRTEAGIAKAANTSDVTILSEAQVSEQTAPDSSKNFITAFLIGLALPVGLIFLKDFFNNKVTSQEDIFKYTTLPILGLVGHNKKESASLIDQNSKSALAEAFRTVRSNLRFMVNNDNKGGKLIVVTSSISGEGKTFSAKNLAYIFAISGERTLLVNADMRKPNNNADFGITSSLGLSNFLAGYTTKEDVIHQTIQENLYILPSGDIPPNPSELLLNKRMDELVKTLRNSYDYIILDTPPVGILSDGLELMQIADANIFMVRQNYTLKSFLNNIQQQYETGKIQNTAILFNDVDYRKLNYGYGYGYGYGYYADDMENRPWWKKFKF